MEAPRKRWTPAQEALFIRSRRPWLALYNPETRKVPVPGSGAACGLDGPLAPIQLLLGPDALLEVFLRCSPRSVCRCAVVCRQWRAVTDSPPIWRAASLAVAEWRTAGSGDAGGATWTPSLTLERYCERFFDGAWKQMYFLRPRLRTDGIYVSRNTYLRRGTVELRSRIPVHLVCYFRYYVFFPNGTFLYRTTPAVPSTQRVLARPRAALRCDGVLSGELRVRDASVHTVIMDTHGRLSHLHTWLRLRSTVPAANNRLDVRSMVSVDDGGAEPEEPAEDFNAYSEEAGLGWHAAHGGLGGWNDGVVRTHTRGLTPYVFVPWDELDASDLNKSAEEMDYYVPG